MPVMTIRLDEETREAMRRVRGVNWSQVLRQKIREVVQQRLRENKVKALLMAQELSREPAEGYDSTEVIRFWRDRRYGPVRSRR
ncbi:MAG: hypothetical protein ACE5HJ_06090 [Thermoplasmata archaeon]